MGLDRFAHKPKAALKVNATTDSGWITKGADDDDSPRYVKGRKVLKRGVNGGRNNGKAKQSKKSGSRLKRKGKMESSEEEEGSDINSSEEEVIDLEASSEEENQVAEEESIGSESSEDDGNGDDNDDEVQVLSSDEEEDHEAVLSRAAREKLTACRKISEKLSAALGGFEAPSEEGGCLGMTELAVDKHSKTKSGWSPVDASLIEAQCEGLSALKPYQTVGVNWLLLLKHQNVSGVLADDMGLGECSILSCVFEKELCNSQNVCLFK